jgi:hypothetical protein
MTEPTVDELCAQLVSWAHDRASRAPGESPIYRFERWIKEDQERGWAVLQGLVERAPRDAEVMFMAAHRVPQLLNRDFRGYRDRVLVLLQASSYLDALLGPEVFIEAHYAELQIEPEYLAQRWLRNSRNSERAKWPEQLDKEDPEVRLRIALEIIGRGPLKGFDSNDVERPLRAVLREFGERVIGAIESAARQSAAVRLAIWCARNLNSSDGLSPKVPAALWARFLAAAGDTNRCNTRTPSGELHRLAPLEEELVEAWFARESAFWAWCELDDLVEEDPERAWSTIVAIVRGAESKAEREHCGAGPLEDLVRTSPELFIGRAEELAQRDPAFREALATMYITLKEVPEPLARRYFTASGRRLEVLDAPEGWMSEGGGAAC